MNKTKLKLSVSKWLALFNFIKVLLLGKTKQLAFSVKKMTKLLKNQKICDIIYYKIIKISKRYKINKKLFLL